MVYGSIIKGDLLQCDAPTSIFLILILQGACHFFQQKNEEWEAERKKMQKNLK